MPKKPAAAPKQDDEVSKKQKERVQDAPGIELNVISNDKNKESEREEESQESVEHKVAAAAQPKDPDDLEQGRKRPPKQPNIIAVLRAAAARFKNSDDLAKQTINEKFKLILEQEDIPQAVIVAQQYSKFLSVYYPEIEKDVPDDMPGFFELILPIYKDIYALQEKFIYWDERMQFSAILLPQSSFLLKTLTAIVDAHYGKTINSITTANTVVQIICLTLNGGAVLGQLWAQFSRKAVNKALITNVNSLNQVHVPVPPMNGPFAHRLQNNPHIYRRRDGLFRLVDPNLSKLIEKEAAPDDDQPGSVQGEILNDKTGASNSAARWQIAEEYGIPVVGVLITILGGAQYWINVLHHGPSTNVAPTPAPTFFTPTPTNTSLPSTNNGLFTSDKFNTTMLVFIAFFTWTMTVISLYARSYRNAANNEADFAQSSLDAMQDENQGYHRIRR